MKTVPRPFRTNIKFCGLAAASVAILWSNLGHSVSPGALQRPPSAGSIHNVAVFSHDRRRDADEGERMRFAGVGRLFLIVPRRGASALETFVANASLLVDRNLILTNAHVFYSHGRLLAPLEQFEFRLIQPQTGQTLRYRLSAPSLRVGTRHPEREPQRDLALLRLATAAPEIINPLAVRMSAQELDHVPLGPLLFLGFHLDRASGDILQVEEGQIRVKAQKPAIRADQLGLYRDPFVEIFDHSTAPKSSSGGVVVLSHPPDLETQSRGRTAGPDYIEVLNVGEIAFSDLRPFSAENHFNFGLRLPGNPVFLSLFQAMRGSR